MATVSQKNGDVRIVAKVVYKGRTYYARWHGICKTGKAKAHLFSLDGTLEFWADLALCDVSPYQTPKTLQGLREYVDGLRASQHRMRGQCVECGNWGPLGLRCRECHEGHFA